MCHNQHEMDLLGTLKFDIFGRYSLILIRICSALSLDSAHAGDPNSVLLLVLVVVVVVLLLLAVDGDCLEADEGFLNPGKTCLQKMILVSFEATSAPNGSE
jgi:hypothetical protein